MAVKQGTQNIIETYKSRIGNSFFSSDYRFISMSVIMVNQVEICCDKNGDLVPQKVAIDLAFNFLSDDGSLTMKSVPETIKDGLEVSQASVDAVWSGQKPI